MISNQVASMHARKWIGFTYKRASEDTITIALGLLKKSCGTYVNGAIIVMLYTHLSGIIKLIIIIITARPRVLVFPYGTGNKE